MKRRNPIAKALRSPHLRLRTEPKKKGKGSHYDRSKMKMKKGRDFDSGPSAMRNAA
jgi:stalled ribosome alternative rescue factor ArfA